jgi:RNA polymerase sigma factor (sigma-70 family)
MSDAGSTDPVAEAFESQRDRLRSVAYRMLGSHADAEDAVQEAWLRLSRQDPASIHNLAGWLTTVVGRISLDVLRSRRARPVASYDDGSPELTVTLDDGPAPAPAPEDDVVLADSVGLALLVVLESLGPSERLAFVLHDLFAVPFDEIGRILGKSTAAAKMLASRARGKVRAAERPVGAGREQREVVEAFLAAARRGDFEGLLRVLDPDVRLTVDTPAGVVVTLGATNVAARARLSAGAATRARPALVNGLPGIVSWREDGTPLSIFAFTVLDARISAITALVNPAKLAQLNLPARSRPAPIPKPRSLRRRTSPDSLSGRTPKSFRAWSCCWCGGGFFLSVECVDEDPGPVVPGLEYVLAQPAADGGGGDRAGDAAGGDLTRQFRARPARQRGARLGGQLAGQTSHGVRVSSGCGEGGVV